MYVSDYSDCNHYEFDIGNIAILEISVYSHTGDTSELIAKLRDIIPTIILNYHRCSGASIICNDMMKLVDIKTKNRIVVDFLKSLERRSSVKRAM